MKRTQVWAGLAIVLTVSLAGCGGAAAPQWTYAPAPSGGVAVGASRRSGARRARPRPPARPRRPARPPAPATSSAPSRSPPSTSASSRPTLTVDTVGAYEVKLVNTGSILHDITFPDGTTIEAAPARRRRRWSRSRPRASRSSAPSPATPTPA